MFNILKILGCGAVMLAALIAMYRVTDSILGTIVISATIGVRQGSPTSCLLFILYVNDLIKLVKENCGQDGFLKWLHLLVLMDDTVFLSTSRESMMMKLTLLKHFCDNYGMKVNISKTKFFVINGSEQDNQTMNVEGLVVKPCRLYVYLGSPFTSDGSVSSAVRAHADAKMAHVNKFISFFK